MSILKRYSWMITIFIAMVISFIFDWGTYDSEIQKTIYFIAPIISLLSGHYALNKIGYKGQRALSLIQIQVGMYLWFIAEIFFLYIDIYDLEPSPSWADFFFIIGYPLFLASVITEWQTFKLNFLELSTKIKLVLTTIIAVVASIVIYLGYFVAFDPEASFLINLIGVSWSLGDLVVGIALVTMLAMVWQFRKGIVKTPWIAFTLWATVNIIADTIYGIFPEKAFDGSTLTIFLDTLWVSGYFFIAFYFLETTSNFEALKKKYLNIK